MKYLLLFFFFALLSAGTCNKTAQDIVPPITNPACIQTKIDAFQAGNKDYTSVKRYSKNNEFFWLFDNGSAFDAPQYLLNTACDTVCTWSFRAGLPCQSNFNLGDSTAVVIWKK
jgi:hypothetical protein